VAPREHPFIGRAFPMRMLAQAFDKALAGHRQTVFVSGDAGIGKTALVDAYLRTLSDEGIRTARGECTEHHGAGEPYMPFISALGDLASGPHARPTSLALRDCAPTWRVQLPWLLESEERSTLEHSLQGTTSVRMLREGALLLEQLSATLPLVLVLENLHWSDDATLDFINALALRHERACLLIIATYRHADVVHSEHRIAEIAHTLVQSDCANSIALAPFGRETVQDYLAARLGNETLATELAPRVLGHSAGNPLLVRSVTEQIVLAQDERADDTTDIRLELSETLRDSVRVELERLDADVRELLEAASVAGLRFFAATLATTLGRDAKQVESNLCALARHARLIRRHDPSTRTGSTMPEFSFLHGSYARIVRDELAQARRRDLHRAIADAVEAANDDRLHELAGSLARHFDEAGDSLRSIDYLAMAAENAERRFAYREAAHHLRTALDRLSHLPQDTKRDQREATLSLKLGSTLMLSQGCSEPEIEETFRRAAERYGALGEQHGQFMARVGLAMNALTRARFDLGVQHAKVLLDMAGQSMSQMATFAGLYAGYTASSLGRFDRAQEVLSTALAQVCSPGLSAYYNVHRMVRSQLATVLTVLGRFDEGRTMAESALQAGRDDGRPGELAHAAISATAPAIMRRDRSAGRASAQLAVEASDRNGFPTFGALARFYAAWHVGEGAESADIVSMEAALEERRALGDRWHESMLLGLLGEAHLARGSVGAARRKLEEAGYFISETGEAYYEAEIRRLHAECCMADAGAGQAFGGFEAAAERATEQGARLWSLRIAVSHARALVSEGDRMGAADKVRAVLEPFDRGLPDADLRDARSLLASLGS